LEGAGEQGAVQGTGHHATLGQTLTCKAMRSLVARHLRARSREAGMFLPVQVLLSVDPWEHDVMHLPVSFLQDVLAPACRGIFCG
jgi:hypothetical protein